MNSMGLTAERKASLLMGGAVVVLACTLAVMLFAPRPKVLMNRDAREDAALKIRIQTKDAEQARDRSQSSVLPRLWKGTPDEVAPAAMKTVTTLIRKHNLRLVAFRPQRVLDEGELSQVPFLISLEGPFPSVAGFVRDIDSSGSRLAVNLVQVASADPSSDRVNATVGAVAFLRPQEPVEDNRG